MGRCRPCRWPLRYREDAVRYAINRAKRAELSEMLAASEAEGSEHTTEEARLHVVDHLNKHAQTRKPA